MNYHLFRRTLTKNGKKIKAWYYWFYDETGKQVRKSCGEGGKPCLTKRDAEKFIENLPDSKTLIASEITFNEYCKNFYDENSRFLKKKLARGIKLMPNTIYQKKLYLEKFLFAFGDKKVNSLHGGDIENWLIELPGCNSAKNHILNIIDDIQKELYSDHLIENFVHVEHFRLNTNEKGILTISEIMQLFPDDYESLIKIWRTKGTDSERDVYNYATMVYTALSTGMRSSEIRALQWNQFIRQDAILINAMIDSSNNRVNRLKKWTDTNKKWRLTILPDKTVKMLNIVRLDKSDSEYVFTYKNQPLSPIQLLVRLKRVFKKQNIDCEGRNITFHSLRFTYNSLMRNEISNDDLRLMIGHTSETMTEYYDKTKALDHLDELLQNKGSLNNVFN